MDKNTVTGFILMALVLILFSWYSRPSKEQLQAQHERDSIAAVQRAEAEKAAEAEAANKALNDSVAKAALDSTSALFAASQGTEQLLTLENDLVKVTINTHGGVIEDVELKNYKDQQKENIHLVSAKDTRMVLSLATKQENIITSDLYFQPVEAPEGQSPEALTLRLPLASGSLDIDYTLRPDAYMVDMIIRANGISNLFTPSMRTLDISWNDRARQLEKGFDFENRYACIRYHEADGSTDNLSETSDKEKDIEEPLDWVAFKNQFFSAVLISQQQLTNSHLKSQVYKKGQGYLKNYEATMQTAFDPTGTQPTQLQMYFGPNDFHTLKPTTS